MREPLAWVLIGVGALAMLKRNDIAETVKGSKVRKFERLDGVAKPLRDFFAWWNDNGPHPIVIAADGGLRTDEALQAELYAKGVSKARNLSETPHGRGCAVDAYPANVKNGVVVSIALDASDPRFASYGKIARDFGFTWGGDWSSLQDLPHIEVKGWRSYPFPPES